MGGAVGRKLSEKLSGVGLDVEQASGLVPPIAPQSRDREGGGHGFSLIKSVTPT